MVPNGLQVKVWVAVALVGCATAAVWWGVVSFTYSGVLRVSFLDVGQGDAVFIESPTGQQVLIDGGQDRRVLRRIANQMPWTDRHIDVVVATHPDEDHVGGLVHVLNRYTADYVVQSGVQRDSGSAAALADNVQSRAGTTTRALRGQVFDLGGGAYLEILFPDRDAAGMDANTASIIARLVYGDTAALFTGDAPKEIERYLVMLDRTTLASDVLKVGHHGSDTSSSALLLGYTSPDYAVMSRGCDNRYGHPHQTVLDALAQFEIAVFDTCTDGTITFVSDGSDFAVQ